MNNKIITFIFRVYISISICVSGYFYINPEKIFANDGGHWKRTFGHNRLLEIDYTYFKYSVLISIVVGILFYSFLQLFKKTKKLN
ncbi:MAG: hypothetical protein QM535_22265 [Limnohabitans sp.]|nr:hypothetical protein [Limnohabitans sp.]